MVIISLALAALFLLAGAGVRHLATQAQLRATLSAHGLFSESIASKLALSLPLVELLLGLGGSWAWFASEAKILSSALLLSGVLYLVFGAYLWTWLRTGSSADCGCGGPGGEQPSKVLIRGITLGVALIVAAKVRLPSFDVSLEALNVVGAALSSAIVLWALPSALGPTTLGEM